MIQTLILDAESCLSSERRRGGSALIVTWVRGVTGCRISKSAGFQEISFFGGVFGGFSEKPGSRISFPASCRCSSLSLSWKSVVDPVREHQMKWRQILRSRYSYQSIKSQYVEPTRSSPPLLLISRWIYADSMDADVRSSIQQSLNTLFCGFVIGTGCARISEIDCIETNWYRLSLMLRLFGIVLLEGSRYFRNHKSDKIQLKLAVSAIHFQICLAYMVRLRLMIIFPLLLCLQVALLW